jgi:hypothetical protein
MPSPTTPNTRAADAASVVGDVPLVDVVCELLHRETESHILCGLLELLERIDCEGRFDDVMALTTNESSLVRKRSTTALAWTLGFDRVHESHRAITRLVAMMEDPDDDVRDWATFAIGSQLFVDGPAIRRALHDRLADAHKDTRDEALHALAARRDRSIADVVVTALRADDVSTLPIQAAAYLADPAFVAPLAELHDELDDDTDIELAVARCVNRQSNLERVAEQINSLLSAWESAPETQALNICLVTDLHQRQADVQPDVSVIINGDWDHPDSLHRVWTHGDGTVEGAITLLTEAIGARGGS